MKMCSNSANLKTLRDDIQNVLNREGLVCQNDEDVLFHLYSLYQKTKKTLKSTLDNIDTVKKQFVDGTDDVHGYIEHITNLSDEREALVLEFQAENKELREQIEQLTQQLASHDDAETRDMLQQNGLEDLVDCRPREQIAFLLVERAKLMDELDEVQDVYDKTAKLSKLSFERRNGPDRRMFDHDDFTETSWCKLKDLLDKVDELETANEHCMQRLKVHAPEEYAQLVEAQHAAANSSSSKIKMSDFVQKKPFVPPKDLQEAITRLEAAEEKAAEAEFLRLALKEKMPERHLDDTINDEESFASMLGSPRAGPNVDRQNAELQNALSSIEAHLHQLMLNSSGAASLTMSGAGPPSEQLDQIRKNFESVKKELAKMMEKYNQQQRKFADCKLSNKNKMHKVKEGFRVERTRLTEEVEKLQNECALIKVTLQKETEYKENMEKSHRSLLTEQRDLQSKLSESEEQCQVHVRDTAVLKVRLQCLEEENMELRQRIDALVKQKNKLERVLKNDKQKVNITINTVSDSESFISSASTGRSNTPSNGVQ